MKDGFNGYFFLADDTSHIPSSALISLLQLHLGAKTGDDLRQLLLSWLDQLPGFMIGGQDGDYQFAFYQLSRLGPLAFTFLFLERLACRGINRLQLDYPIPVAFAGGIEQLLRLLQQRRVLQQQIGATCSRSIHLRLLIDLRINV